MEMSERKSKDNHIFGALKNRALNGKDTCCDRAGGGRIGDAPDAGISGLKSYRSAIKQRNNFSWHISYKNSDVYISSDRDIKCKIAPHLKEIYSKIEMCIKKDPVFLRALSPVPIKPFYPAEIKEMCRVSEKFNVGPMAAVAGAVNDYIAGHLSGYCGELVIENGGDIFLKSGRDLIINLYIRNPYFEDRLNIKIAGSDTPCGICSSSGTFGHSLSLGKCDLATVISKSSTIADAAATAAANRVKSEEDILPAIDYFKNFNDILGVLLVKGKKIGMWGKFRLLK